MAMSLTFAHPGHRAKAWWPVLATAMLIAVVGSAAACEKASPARVAGASGETRAAGTFTGEFVNGAPVYRLPSINVVGRRQVEVAKTQRDSETSRSGRSRASSAPAVSAPNPHVANVSRDVNAITPCIG